MERSDQIVTNLCLARVSVGGTVHQLGEYPFSYIAALSRRHNGSVEAVARAVEARGRAPRAAPHWSKHPDFDAAVEAGWPEWTLTENFEYEARRAPFPNELASEDDQVRP